MSRRNIKIAKSYGTLVLDMPLSNGDIRDHVSGGRLANHNYSWNASVGGYVFTQNSMTDSNTALATGLNLPFSAPFTPKKILREMDLYPIGSQHGNFYVIGHQSTIGRGGSFGPLLCFFAGNINSPNNANYLTTNTWHHIRQYIDASGYYKTWIDGMLKLSGTAGTITDSRFSGTKMYISCGNWNNGSNSVSFGMKNLKYYIDLS